MVRLKDLFRGKRVYFLTYFNSTMVRLKARKTLKDFPKWTYFNSTMVRLKEMRLFLQFTQIVISIPLWYD